jgi:vitamin B12 transporter
MAVRTFFCSMIRKRNKYLELFLSVIVAGIFFSLPVNCQQMLSNDTIKISEVVINRKNISIAKHFQKETTIDSSILRISGHETLAGLISENTNIYFKSYGGGGSATISMRGTGAGHTQLEWNGISICNPMLGQSDFSIVPALAADRIHILYGSESIVEGSGGIGGIINIETKPYWQNKTSLTLIPGAGSFGRYTGAVSLQTGNLNFQSSTKIFTDNSENDFRYLNSEAESNPAWETMIENRVRGRGIIQEIYSRRANQLISARFWYQSSERELPSSMLTRQPGQHEKQNDEAFRTMISYENHHSRSDLFLTGAFLSNSLNYSNNLASIDSRNQSQTLVLKSGFENKLTEDLKIRFFMNDEITRINSNNYSGIASRNLGSVTVSAEKICAERIGATILIRESVDGTDFLIPDFSAGLKYRLINAHEYFLKASITRNSKIPSMNDMYWYPGGNKNLRNESALQYELSGEMTGNITPSISLYYDLSAFRYDISDMVLWRPGDYSYWKADNIQNVNSTGFETTFRLIYTGSQFVSELNAGYSFTRSVSHADGDAHENYQLPYIPVHQANTTLNLSYKKMYSVLNCNMTGRKYITSDNSDNLPGYFLTNISTGVKMAKKGGSIDMSFHIDNLFNVSYQAIAHYPMPGRAYFLKLIMNITK